MTVAVSDLASARRAEFLELMRDVYGHAMSEEEFDWFFDRNPAGPRVLSAAEHDGRLAGVLAMTLARAVVEAQEETVAFSVHAVTSPAARGKGVFSTLELRNEERAAAAGASIALGFTNPMAGPILVGKLGWRDLYRMRLWARVLHPVRALRRRGRGGLATGGAGMLTRFTDEHEAAWRHVQPAWGNCLVRSADYLNWRYVAAPKDYRAFTLGGAYAVVGHATLKGVSTGVVCDLVGPPAVQRRLLRRCVREASAADVVVGVPAPDQRRAWLATGFVPTPQTIRVIGKPLTAGAEPPTAWHFSLGDTDFL